MRSLSFLQMLIFFFFLLLAIFDQVDQLAILLLEEIFLLLHGLDGLFELPYLLLLVGPLFLLFQGL